MRKRRAFKIGLVLTGMALPALSAELSLPREELNPAKRKAICGAADNSRGLLTVLANCRSTDLKPDRVDLLD